MWDIGVGSVLVLLLRFGTPLHRLQVWSCSGAVVLMTGKGVWLDLYGGKLLAASRSRLSPYE